MAAGGQPPPLMAAGGQPPPLMAAGVQPPPLMAAGAAVTIDPELSVPTATLLVPNRARTHLSPRVATLLACVRQQQRVSIGAAAPIERLVPVCDAKGRGPQRGLTGAGLIDFAELLQFASADHRAESETGCDSGGGVSGIQPRVEQQLQIPQLDRLAACMGPILHDIGATPFDHATIISSCAWTGHQEEVSWCVQQHGRGDDVSAMLCAARITAVIECCLRQLFCRLVAAGTAMPPLLKDLLVTDVVVSALGLDAVKVLQVRLHRLIMNAIQPVSTPYSPHMAPLNMFCSDPLWTLPVSGR